VLIKHLVRRTARGVELRQFNPDLTVEVHSDAVQALEKIAGELI